jgi:hypothetical protein
VSCFTADSQVEIPCAAADAGACDDDAIAEAMFCGDAGAEAERDPIAAQSRRPFRREGTGTVVVCNLRSAR